MLNHKVSIAIEDQVAVTTVEQTFRNHTDRPLEATYIFPVPKGASVRKFTMWVDGKEVPGELVEADKARKIYTAIVRRTQDPGLLEYMGNNLLKLRVFPVPANGDQKVAISYTVDRQQRQRRDRVRLSAEDRRQGRRHAGEVHASRSTLKSQHPLHQHLQPDARHHHDPPQRPAKRSSASRRTRRCSTRTSSSSTRRRQGRRPDRA